jgi:molybdopterin molybdotransferase
MAISYEASLGLVRATANTRSTITLSKSWETVPLQKAVGRIQARHVRSPIASPAHDTSAMDGYAISSAATLQASPERPVRFRVVGTNAAGKPIALFEKAVADGYVNDGGMDNGEAILPCLEIMTGARFPVSGEFARLDACVRCEHVGVGTLDQLSEGVDGDTNGAGHDKRRSLFGKGSRAIVITQPVAPGANRRRAGSDIQKGQVLLREGQRIAAVHLMPLLSVGITDVAVRRRPRIGLWSTGAEMLSSDENSGVDVNGPYLMAALHEIGCEASFLGVLDDEVQSMARAVAHAIAGDDYDLLISTGGVSVGKYDFVPSALESLGANVVFHGVNIRPGHPVLFAQIPRPVSSFAAMPFFGLPGNPGAAAACFRFLVAPFLRSLHGQTGDERPVVARLVGDEAVPNGHSLNGNGKHGGSGHALQQCDVFRPGDLRLTENGEWVVEDLGRGKGPSMLAPFAAANCWIHLACDRNDAADAGENKAACYTLSPHASGDWS